MAIRGCLIITILTTSGLLIADVMASNDVIAGSESKCLQIYFHSLI